MTIHISSWRATWRRNAAQCSSANIMGRKSGSIIVGNVAIWDGKPDNTVRHTHFTRAPVGHAHVAVPLLAWSCWRQRILTWDLSENPTSQSSRLTHEGSFHAYPSGLWCHYTTWGPMSQRLSWVINCCLVFVRQWWRLCHASRSSTAQWQWPCSYHHHTIMRLVRSAVGFGRPLYVHLISWPAILRQ